MNEIKRMSQDDLRLEAMQSMGWNLDAQIPMASAENLKILKEMEEMTQLKFQLNEKLKSFDERDKIVQRHKKNIEAAIQQNMTLYNTMRSDLLKEGHLYKLTNLEHFKIKEDLRNNQKEYEKFCELKERVERQLKAGKCEIDDLTKRVKFAKSTLLEWTNAMEEGNKGYQLIEKYYKDDQQRARELNQKRQELQAEIDRRRRKIVQMYDEQQTLEKNLARTADLYRAGHHERRQMVNTWKSAVNQMTQLENEIKDGEDQLYTLNATAAEKAEEYQTHNQQLNDIIENNRKVEATIEQLNNDSSDTKEQIQRIAEMCYLKQRDMETLQKELANLANRVEMQRTENRLRHKEKLNKIQEIESFDEVLQKIQDRLKDIENKNLNAAQRFKVLEDMNETEQKSLSELTKESERVNELLFRTQEKIRQLNDDEKRLTVNNDSLATTLNAIKRNQKNTEKELQRQTDILYKMEWKYLEVERRLNYLKGNIVDPEVEIRNLDNLAQLEHIYAEIQRRIQMTDTQNKKLNNSMNKMVGVFNKDNKELDLVKFKIKEAQVYCEGTTKRLKERHVENQERIVELNLLKMRCRDMENEISKADKGTFDLEQHRIKMRHAVKERLAELKSQEEILLLKRNHLTDELSTLRADMGERNKCIDALRTRFELTAKLLGTNDDGTLVTTTQIKVELTQQKQLLSGVEEELKQKIATAEQEVTALENTLRQFDKSNENYRQTFRKDDNVTDKLGAEVKQLQLEYCEKLNELKLLRCKAQRYEHQLEKHRGRRDDMEKSLQLAREKYEEDSRIYEKLQKEVDEQNTKILRADREIKITLKQIKERLIDREFIQKFDLDLNLQELENRNMRALNQLTDMASSDPDSSKIIDLMINKGLQLPQHLKKSCSYLSLNSNSSLSSITSAASNVKTGVNKVKAAKRDKACSVSSTSVMGMSPSCVSVVTLDFPGLN